MWKKTKKNKTPNPPSHPPDFRALLPLAGAIARELEPVLADSVLLEEFWPSVVEGDVGSGLELVDVGLVGLVVEGLMGAVLEVAALVVEIVVVEELTRVAPGMVDVEELMRVMPGMVDVEELMRVMPRMVDVEELTRVMPGMVDVEELTRVMPGMVDVEELTRVMPVIVDIEKLTFRQGLFGPWQAYPGGQHPSEHLVDPAGQGFRHLFVPASHIVPISQHPPLPSPHM